MTNLPKAISTRGGGLHRHPSASAKSNKEIGSDLFREGLGISEDEVCA